MTDRKNTILMIANPRAGRKRSKSYWNSMEKQFKRSKNDVIRWETTSYPKHAESLAFRASLDGISTIIAVGGDGTIHEVVNGMMQNPENQSILGWIPAGTANDYAASFTCESHGNETPSPTLVDIGILKWDEGCRYFANVAGVGLSGAIADRARLMKRIPARIRYTLALLLQTGPQFGTRNFSLSVDHDRTLPSDTLMMSVAIGRREGSYPLHADANPSDGLFDWLHLGKLTRFDLARHFPAMLLGNLPTNHPHVQRGRCTRLDISSSDPIAIHLDGESPNESPCPTIRSLSIEIIPRAISCITTRSLYPQKAIPTRS